MKSDAWYPRKRSRGTLGGPLRVTPQRLHRIISRWSSEAAQLFVLIETDKGAATMIEAIRRARPVRPLSFRRLRSLLRLVYAQDLDPRRRDKNFAEGVHPAAGLVARADAAVSELVELVEFRQLDLELQGHTTVATSQRHQQACVQAFAAGGLDLAADKVNRALPIYWQHVIRKASQVHRALLSFLSSFVASAQSNPLYLSIEKCRR